MSLKLSPAQALLDWGRPTSPSDITSLFAQYLSGNLQCLPWCDEPLHSETSAITNVLAKLTAQKGWWTVASQPAVDGVRSSDATYGFGPKGGYIYQKAFVEFWASGADVEKLAERVAQNEEATGVREVTFYAGSKDQGWKTNMTRGDANAVTWGVFAGKEIVTPTLIEEVSFKAWKVRLTVGHLHPVQSTNNFMFPLRQDEAFEIWSEWSKLFPQSSESRKCLESIMDEYWLVSVVHHDYKNSSGLWDFLLQ